MDSGEGPGRGRAPTRFPGKVFGRIPGVLGEKVAVGFGDDRKVLDKVPGRLR